MRRSRKLLTLVPTTLTSSRLRFRHEVSEVGLHSTETVDVLFRSHLVGLAFITELLDLLLRDGATLTSVLETLHLFQQFSIDAE